MLLKLIVDLEELKIEKLSFILDIIKTYDKEGIITELIITKISMYIEDRSEEMLDSLDILLYETLLNSNDIEVNDYASNKLLIYIGEYVSFFENNIAIKTMLYDIKKELGDSSFYITDFLHKIYDSKLILDITFTKNDYY